MATEKNVVTNAVAKEVAAPTKGLETKAAQFSLIWVVPIIAFIIFVIFLWNNTINNGQEIKLIASSAQGIEEGTTKVKMRSVTVGVVKDVALADDYTKAILTVQMDTGTDELLREDSSFWIVKPRIDNAGVSGLDTILSGAYIQMSMGSSPNYSNYFTALYDPPLYSEGENGITVSLYSNDTKKLNKGDLVTYRGFNVGLITEVKFDFANDKINYKAFIQSPYDKIVNYNTKFWISSGFEFKIDTNGAELHTESIDNLIQGGITFDNFIDNFEDTPIFDNNNPFELFAKKEDARLSSLEGSLLYVVMLEDSLQNIAAGSSVIYRGVKVGEVVKAPWFKDMSDVFTSQALPIMISIDSNKTNKKHIAKILNNYLKDSSLCASIGSTNMIIANNQIDLKVDPKKQCTVTRSVYKIKDTLSKGQFLTYRGYNVIPLIPSQSLTAQLDTIVEKLKEFDMAGFSSELQNSLKAFASAMNAFTSSNSEVQRTKVIEKLATAFHNFNNSVKGYGPDTPVYKALHQNLKNIEKILNDIAPALDEFGQSPSSLIFGSPVDPIPQAPRADK